ncbi:MAG: SoxR reducing system RseC family protein [Treponemataceae bacterium]|nr:SoxR reducing system RseC family protein [Treponemataceae bacterium]
MEDKAVVVAMDNEILVSPLLTGACINCERSSCAKKGRPFSVSNPQNFPISVGSIVHIRASKKSQIAQGFIALFLPIVTGILIYFLASFLCVKFSLPKPQLIQFLSTLLGIVLISVLIYLLNSKKSRLHKSEICSVD